MAQRPTTELGASIMATAQMWIDCYCKETRTNGGNCIDDMTASWTGRGPWNVPYCAITCWVWYVDGAQAGGFIPLFPKTSGASMLVINAKKWGFLVDQNPTPGCFFYRNSTLQGRKSGSEISGHCGVVFDWDDTYLYTAEGNSSQQIRAVRTSWDRMKELNVTFIHVEQNMVPAYVLIGGERVRQYVPLVPPPNCRPRPVVANK